MSPTEPVLRLYLLEVAAPGIAGLRSLLPELVRTPLGLEIPLTDHRPEEILALCLHFGITARATRIGERVRAG